MQIDIKKILKSKITIFVIATGLLAVGVVGFFHYRNTVFSREIVHLEISGPKTAAAGEEIEYIVTYKNNSNFTLEEVKIVFELPDYSLTEDGKLRLTQDIKDIHPGDERLVRFKARLLGKEDDVKTARARLSYVPHNLSARYESDAAFATKITVVDMDLGFDLPAQIEENKEVTYALNYLSRVDYPLENVSIKVETGGGFDVVLADPESLDNVEWKLAVLQKESKGKISITGASKADAGSRIIFSARLGMRVKGIFIVLKEVKQEVEIIEPLLVISQQINGSFADTGGPGEVLHYQLTFKNTGQAQLDGMQAVSTLSGPAFDFSTLQSSQGQVLAGNTITFLLPALAPGQEASVNFSIKLKDTIAEADKVIKNTVSSGGVTQEFITNVNAGSANPTLLEFNLGQ
ncbi:MAG: hypothetical protein A3C50_03950 [Candidatus Staskawiczbacteria bacterium RIFCSPHIGHO2_02_FULL_43_16]|uniref:DUF11 domain-containing protein n=1 Tax=Candidatus Staskawiczbacteria bacterium RIFCSPHIGHO2_01_FULL_41_41 TaxID=1802203 RepID=A0A1G2HRU4_9BACT|nr:MAG: hypothetical protein A2822_03835 [Candidatus Staskawiczbacteria bacterium RIFCSPHIGHO2_01_FULL_41_41]OGZ68085.1 MAG: hypothetical protein A3C50_03950 [Candidatus Staskawiczbacteria bacterium RIFCSPHIGHO2_02_FULL_43_16]OGZ74823.1 MAG: hypothetical protein A3A12_03140 [Candidatus Staskawiczbacteria bacterium RIFCSPLOWO2_01_FULL_43_17b]